jgi:nitroreductase
MDFETLVNTRQSCRNFDSSKEVAKEDILAVLEAARLAPSASNSQLMLFTVCANELAKTAAVYLQSFGLNKFAVKAPCLIVVSEKNYNLLAAAGSKVKRQDWRSVDIGIAVSYLTLAATERGLSTCIMGSFDEKKLKELLGIKERIRLVVALGYAMEDDAIRPKKRKSMDEIADFR